MNHHPLARHQLQAVIVDLDGTMIDTVGGWNAKQVEPRAVLLVSRTARRALVASAATKPAWVVARKRDAVRGIWDDFYECPRQYLRGLDWLVKRLRP